MLLCSSNSSEIGIAGRASLEEACALTLRNCCVIVGVVLALSGCARPPTIPTPLASARICCNSLADLPMQSLPFGEVQSIAFDEKTSPVFRFPEGNGVFAAFRLPERAFGAKLEVRAFFSSIALPMASIVKPNAMFLDAGYEPLQISRDAPLQVRQGLLAMRMSRVATFPVPAGAAYVVVYSGDSRAKRVFMSSENGTIYAIPFAYTGDVEVTLEKSN
ncbi:hypothetical protein [Cupriavidus basilensis]